MISVSSLQRKDVHLNVTNLSYEQKTLLEKKSIIQNNVMLELIFFPLAQGNIGIS